MTHEGGFNNTATIDHVVPRGRGGKNEMDNKVAACYRCNNARGDMPAHLFWAIVNREDWSWDLRPSIDAKLMPFDSTILDVEEIKRMIDECDGLAQPRTTSPLADHLDQDVVAKLRSLVS